MSKRTITIKSGQEEIQMEVTEEEYQKYYRLESLSFDRAAVLPTLWKNTKAEARIQEESGVVVFHLY